MLIGFSVRTPIVSGALTARRMLYLQAGNSGFVVSLPEAVGICLGSKLSRGWDWRFGNPGCRHSPRCVA
jgi:hypothetical protein